MWSGDACACVLAVGVADTGGGTVRVGVWGQRRRGKWVVLVVAMWVVWARGGRGLGVSCGWEEAPGGDWQVGGGAR